MTWRSSQTDLTTKHIVKTKKKLIKKLFKYIVKVNDFRFDTRIQWSLKKK